VLSYASPHATAVRWIAPTRLRNRSYPASAAAKRRAGARPHLERATVAW